MINFRFHTHDACVSFKKATTFFYILRISARRHLLRENLAKKNHTRKPVPPPWHFSTRNSLAALSANLLFHGLIHSAFLVRGHYSRRSDGVARVFLFGTSLRKSVGTVGDRKTPQNAVVHSKRRGVPAASLRDPTLWFISQLWRIAQRRAPRRESWKMRGR